VRVLVNRVRLSFDVEGPGLVPDGPAVLSSLADIVQIVFLDHRGNGRSDPGPQSSWIPALGRRRACLAFGASLPHVRIAFHAAFSAGGGVGGRPMA